MSDAAKRITDYLVAGGLVNPELANHGEVRDLLIECRAELWRDTALIRQFIESLDKDRHDTEDWPDDSRNALAALRARLEGES